MKYFRFQSFGDSETVEAAINVLLICMANPKIRFSVWTKNIMHYEKAISLYGKPKNLNILISTPFINACPLALPNWANGTFTVYRKDYIESNRIKINCGKKCCSKCLNCYKKHNKQFHISEELKSDNNKGREKAAFKISKAKFKKAMEVYYQQSGLKLNLHRDNEKMAGFFSLSTNPKDNKYCMERAKNKKTICSKCYACAQCGFCPALRDMLSQNGKAMNQIIPLEKLTFPKELTDLMPNL